METSRLSPTTYEALSEAFQTNGGDPYETFTEWLHSGIEAENFDPSLWFLAMGDGDQITGVILSELQVGEERTLGWISEVGVRLRWRKRGLALALLYHAFGEFYRRGVHTCALVVDAANPSGATRLYERAGASKEFKPWVIVIVLRLTRESLLCYCSLVQESTNLEGRSSPMPIDAEALRHIPLFATLSQEELEHVAALTVERHYDRGDLILLEGDLGGALQYVRSGLVKVYKTSPAGKDQVLHLITAGNTFNDVPALDGGPNPASAAALEPSTIYVISRAELRKLILTRPEVAEAVVKTLANALRHLVSLVEDLSLRHVTARVAKILLDQEASAREGHQVYRMTQQEMAALAGTAREVVGRALKELEAAGAIKMRQGRAVVVDLERLRVLSSGYANSTSQSHHN